MTAQSLACKEVMVGFAALQSWGVVFDGRKDTFFQYWEGGGAHGGPVVLLKPVSDITRGPIPMMIQDVFTVP